MFEMHADRSPNKTALTFGSWGTSYAQIEQRANRLAACLQQRQATTNKTATGAPVIGLCVEAGINQLAGLLGILKFGGICVLLDPRDPPTRLKDIIKDAALTFLVGESALASALGWPQTHGLWFDADTAEIIAAPDGRMGLTANADPDTPAVVIYRPDAAGQPRGVAITHRAATNLLQGLQDSLGMSVDDRVLATAAPTSAAAIIETLLPLSLGAELVLASLREVGDSESLERLITASRATAMFAQPGVWQRLVAHGWPGDSAMRAICIGDVPTPALAAQLAATCAGFWTISGSVDGAIVATCGRVERPAESLHGGRPIANTQAWILDDRLQPCPIGAIGEIFVGGASLGQPFGLRASAANDEWVANPAIGEASVVGPFGRLRRTRSRGRWLVSGYLQPLGRTDRQRHIKDTTSIPRAPRARCLPSPAWPKPLPSRMKPARASRCLMPT